MPGMNGREMARRLATQHAETACIYISGYPVDTLGSQGILEKGLEYLPKPFSREQLAGKIRAMLDPH